MLQALQNATKRCVGVKQTEKAVLRQQALSVYIGSDADERIIEGLQRLCREQSIEVVDSFEMLELGRACGIQVRAGAAAILKE